MTATVTDEATSVSDTGDKRLRFRRCKSVTRAEEITLLEARVRKSQPDKPCHRPRDSLFSWSSGFNSYAGFINWGFLLLLMGGLRLLLENLIKYGIRANPYDWLTVLTGGPESNDEYPTVLLFLYAHAHILLALIIEKGLAKDILTSKTGNIAHAVNLLLLVLLPIIAINTKPNSFSLLGASFVCTVYCIIFLKLWSYAHVNFWCRSVKAGVTKKRFPRSFSTSFDETDGIVHKSNKTSNFGHHPHVVQYPANLTIKDLYYFLLIPTLCYELNFPRSNRIRKRFLMKRILEVVIGGQAVIALFQQWIIPSVKNSLIPFSQMDVMKATERLLKLAIPNHLLWLICFYLLFHSLMNTVGELLKFADRDFYGDWWNSNNVEIFWRQWNLPVHRWAVRHLYIPVIEMGYGRLTASCAVFFTSAFFHEFLVSVPLRTFKIWAFSGMMSQIPLSIVSMVVDKRYGSHWGNIIMWAGLILGQPLCIMMYYHDYVITHFGQNVMEQFGTTT